MAIGQRFNKKRWWKVFALFSENIWICSLDLGNFVFWNNDNDNINDWNQPVEQ